MPDRPGERLQKVLAGAGYGSRRELESLIRAGRITVNGEVATLGVRVGERDKIAIDGRNVPRRRLKAPKHRTIGYHKPVGEICTRSDPDGRPTVFGSLPPIPGRRWLTVGRLDLNTSGLLLCTTDGDLAQRLTHPSYQVPREYAVRVRGQVSNEDLAALRSGVELEDGPAAFNDIVHAGGDRVNQWYHVVLTEGRQREVRRLWQARGLEVSRLIRVRYGTALLRRDKPAGSWWELEDSDVQALRELVTSPVPRNA